MLLTDGTNVNHALVKDGWWWWYRKYAVVDKELAGLEAEAREAKRGLWAGPSWEWRKKKWEVTSLQRNAVGACWGLLSGTQRHPDFVGKIKCSTPWRSNRRKRGNSLDRG